MKEASFLPHATRVIPIISSVIDEKGGFASMGEVGRDSRVAEALALIPDGHKKTVKAVVDKFPEYVTSFDGGRVATAMGYDTGRVSLDGTVQKKPKDPKSKKKGAASAAAAPASPPPPPASTTAVPSKAKSAAAPSSTSAEKTVTAAKAAGTRPSGRREPMFVKKSGAATKSTRGGHKGRPLQPMKDLDLFIGDKAKLTYLSQRLVNACERGTDHQIEETMIHIRHIRAMVGTNTLMEWANGGASLSNADGSSKSKNNSKKKKEKVPEEPVIDRSSGMGQAALVEHAVQMVRECHLQGVQPHLNQLCNGRGAKEVKTALAECRLFKMNVLFRSFPQTFQVNDSIVSVLPSYIPYMPQDMVKWERPQATAWRMKQAQQQAAQQAMGMGMGMGMGGYMGHPQGMGPQGMGHQGMGGMGGGMGGMHGGMPHQSGMPSLSAAGMGTPGGMGGHHNSGMFGGTMF